jgi:predicted nucleic acid-binding protein
VGVIYLESSALLTWLLGEHRAREIAGRIDTAEAVASSSLTLVEVRRTLVRLVAERRVKPAQMAKALGVIESLRTGWVVFPIGPDIEDRAGQPFPLEPVRTLDAIHLATALRCAQVFDGVTVLSLDRRILDNAEALGLA